LQKKIFSKQPKRLQRKKNKARFGTPTVRKEKFHFVDYRRRTFVSSLKTWAKSDTFFTFGTGGDGP
jgi:hypothetical protein